MTKKIPGAVLGKPPKPIPADAAVRIEALAADGFSVVGVAKGLGVSKNTLSKWYDTNPELKDAFDRGREVERHTLHNMLYRQAMEGGNATAAMFLLKARHGYREGAEVDAGNHVNIVFQLPGAMTMDSFKVIQHEPDSVKRISE